MRPFEYPSRRHQRTQRPPSFADHAGYKPYLRREFSGQCVYCRLPDALMKPETFHVDHYRPRSKFPERATDYTNLFYACPACNRYKGDFWPDAADLRAGRVVPNCCDHALGKHLRYSGVEVRGVSKPGRFTIERLRLNSPKDLEYRRYYSEMVELYRQKIRETRELLAEEKAARESTSTPVELRRVERNRALLSRYESHLLRLESRLNLGEAAEGAPDDVPRR